MKKGAIFDLDGTLVFSPGLHVEAWKNLFNLYQITLTEEELKEQAGYKNVVFIKKVLERRKIDHLDIQKLSDQKDEMVIEILKADPAKVFPGVEELLKLLKSNRIKLALATNATKKTALVLGQKLILYFDTEIFAEDVEHGKPDPEIFLKAAKNLKLASNECIVFEDAENGVATAKAGGFFCIARDNNLGQNLSAADLIINDYRPQKLLKLFIG